jgi:hypothetical protein
MSENEKDDLDVVEESRSLMHAEAKIETLGLPRPKKPKLEEGDSVKWPSNIADLSTDQLAQHLTWWSGWSGYARYYLAKAETNYENFVAAYNLEISKGLYCSKGEYSTLTEIKASIEQRPEMIKRKKVIQRHKAQVTMLKSLLQGYEDKYATASREISRRDHDFHESIASVGRRKWRANS